MKDVLGAACSGLCMIHCLGTPLLAAAGTSAFGLAILSSESAHLWLSVAMISIALLAFPSSWRIHKRFLPSALALVGTVLMVGALLLPEEFEVYWAVSSAVAFICGHLMNRRLLTMENNK